MRRQQSSPLPVIASATPWLPATELATGRWGATTARPWGAIGWGATGVAMNRRLATAGAATFCPATPDPQTASEGVAAEAEEDPVERRRRTEAVLLFHKGSVALRKLAGLAELADATEARTRIRELNELYDLTGGALRIEEIAGGYQLMTRPGLAPWLRRLKHLPSTVRLGSAAMETLAIIAYRQPVARADIEAVRGVACGELIRQLMQRDLVRICGRGEELGRPYLYGTTPYFLQIFGLKNVNAIPTLPGASIRDDSDDTFPFVADPSQASEADSPIEALAPDPADHPLDLTPPETSPPAAVTTKESDVSIAAGPVASDEVIDFLNSGSALGLAEPTATAQSGALVIDDDDDEFFDDDVDDDVDVDDDEDDDDWDDDDVEDDDDDDDDDEWEEVGDDEGDDEDDDDDVEDDVDVEADDEIDEEEDELEDGEWVDDDEDDDWSDDDEDDEEWD